MDPDANFRERIAIMRNTCIPFEQQRARFDELTQAYAEWRERGGFVADRALRDEFFSLYVATLHG